jgi:hypothetical protein
MLCVTIATIPVGFLEGDSPVGLSSCSVGAPEIHGTGNTGLALLTTAVLA